LFLIRTFARVVGDCLATKPSARTPNNGGSEFCSFLIHTSSQVVGDCFTAKPSARTPNNGGNSGQQWGWPYTGRAFRRPVRTQL